tara:strand:+ start:903 stop:1166 length:264 start_codon:yes stop_codon:yes gene_type:complete
MIHMTKRHLSGLRMSVAIGIILPVAAEMIGPELGVGAYILLPGCLAATEKIKRHCRYPVCDSFNHHLGVGKAEAIFVLAELTTKGGI